MAGLLGELDNEVKEAAGAGAGAGGADSEEKAAARAAAAAAKKAQAIERATEMALFSPDFSAAAAGMGADGDFDVDMDGPGDDDGADETKDGQEASTAAGRRARRQAQVKARLFSEGPLVAPSKARALARAQEEEEARRAAGELVVSKDSGGWWDAAAASASSSGAASPTADATLPTDLPMDSDVLRMYWFDAYEDPYRNPGIMYLFGKVLVGPKTWASICVVVRGLERCMFVLPREKPDGSGERYNGGEVYQELTEVMKAKLPSDRCRFRVKQVKRNYCFEVEGVPREETNYLKLVYSGELPELDSETCGRTFSKVFGTRTTMLEHFLLKRDLMGPCWLELRGVKRNDMTYSWCKYEVTVDSPKQITRMELNKAAPSLPTPSMSVLSLSLKTVVNKKSHTHEVVLASVLFHKGVEIDGPTPARDGQISHFTAIRAPGDGIVLPLDLREKVAEANAGRTVKIHSNERALLSFLVAKIAQLDPDVILGHNITGFDLDVLLHRIAKNKVPNWSRIGRLRRSVMPRTSSSGGKESYMGVLTAGRLCCDTYLSARELIRETTYALTALVQSQLGLTRRDVEPQDVPRYFEDGEKTMWLIKHTENDAYLALQLMFRLVVLPLTKQITNLSGNLWSRSLKGARAERIEYLLLHEFHRLKYIVPDKERSTGGSGTRKRQKPSYGGGLVLEPKRGLYDKFILLLDFNSLYPSIIQEYNLCFTTVDRALTGELPKLRDSSAAGGAGRATKRGRDDSDDDGEDGDSDEEGGGALVVPQLPDPTRYSEMGILPRVIRNLVQRRRQVKNLMKSESDKGKREQLDIRQKALKILANSMYGCLGFSKSRFYAMPIAALVTSQGRDILQNTVQLAEDTLGLEVIYGDTDSIMINTRVSDDLDRVKQMGRDVKREVNKLYKTLEIEIDGVFKMMLLLKKKKYAALVVQEHGPGKPVTYEKEMKGLDLVRRDWCVLSREVGERVLDLLLSGKETEDIVEELHDMMGSLAKTMRANELPLAKYVITKGLNKAPHEYPDAKGLPHLQVALNMVKQGKTVNVGDHIPYVVCNPTPEAPSTPSPAAAATAGAGGADDAPGAKPSPSSATSPLGGPAAASPVAPPKRTSGKVSAASRAKHPTEVARSKGLLQVDVEWYLSNQILPPIARLCEPIEGTSQARLAEVMGLDASRFKTYLDTDERDEDFTPSSVMDDTERFKECEPLRVRCARCNTHTNFPGVYRVAPDGVTVSSGLVCARPGCGGLFINPAPEDDGRSVYQPPLKSSGTARKPKPSTEDELDMTSARLLNTVTRELRRHIERHYEGWLVCDDAMCGNRTRQMTTQRQGMACTRPGCRGRVHEEYPSRKLHNQITHFFALLDESWGRRSLEKADRSPCALPADHKEVLQDLAGAARRHLEACAYQYLRLDRICAYTQRIKAQLATGASLPAF